MASVLDTSVPGQVYNEIDVEPALANINENVEEERALSEIMVSLTISSATSVSTTSTVSTPITIQVVVPATTPTTMGATVDSSTTVLPTTALAPPPKRPKERYVVSNGKRTGVFDDWLDVHSLTSGVSGSAQKAYPSRDEAFCIYNDLKHRGLVHVNRQQGDEELHGPLEDAMQ